MKWYLQFYSNNEILKDEYVEAPNKNEAIQAWCEKLNNEDETFSYKINDWNYIEQYEDDEVREMFIVIDAI